MHDPAVLFIKPGAISDKDRRALARAGIIVVNIDDPASVKLVRAASTLPACDLMRAAGKAMKSDGAVMRIFGDLIADLMMAHTTEPTSVAGGIAAAIRNQPKETGE